MLKTTGRLAALLLVSGVVGAVLFGVMRSKKSPAAPAQSPVIDFGAPPDVSNSGTSSADGSPQDLIALADEGAWTRVDPATGRVRFKMTWSRLDPEAMGEFKITRPRIWMIENGRTLRLESAEARVVWPSRDEAPEAGDLTGGVVLEAIEGERLDEARRASETIGTVRTESLSFNQPARELRAPGTIALDAAGVRAESAGMTMRLGAEGAAPISMLRLEKAGRVEFDPEAQRASSTKSPSGAGKPGGTSAGDSTTQYHRLVMTGGIRLVAGSRSISGEALTLLAKTVGGRLSDGAIATFEPSQGETKSAANDKRTDSESASQSSLLTWDGGLEFFSLGSPPDGLGREEIAVEVSGPAGGVLAQDTERGGRISAASIAYGATNRLVTVRGGAGPLEAQWPDVARLRCDRIELDLTTGAGTLIGAGDVRLLGEASGLNVGPTEVGSRGAKWSERAEFTLDTSAGPIGSSDRVDVQQARLAGAVDLFEGEARIGADGLRAYFDPAPSAAPNANTALTRVTATGGALARDANGGTVYGKQIDVIFERGGDGQPRPTIATVRGEAKAEREGESLAAELIEATIATDSGKSRIASVTAEDRVIATIGRDGSVITVRARTLRADASLEQAEFIGDPVTIERAAPDGTGTLSGGSMRVEAREGAQRLTIFGAGMSRYASRDSSGRDAVIEVDWDGGLIYTDSIGRAEVEGNARARFAMGDNERHTATGARIVVDITPASSTTGGERELSRALIEGTDEAPAEVELRRYIAGTLAGDEGTLEGLAFLRGPSVELAGGATRLSVNGPGVLLLEDRRPASESAASGDERSIEFNGMRGTTLFTWEQGMMLDRATGLGEMTQGVLIRHRDASAAQIAEVACARAMLSINESSAGSGDLSGITLSRAEALGGVTARYKTLQMESARLIYESGGRIIAASEPNGRITIFDEADGRSISGEAAIVDTSTGTYRIERLDSIAVPR